MSFNIPLISDAIDDLCCILDNPTCGNEVARVLYDRYEGRWSSKSVATDQTTDWGFVRAGVKELQMLLASNWLQLDNPNDELRIINSGLDKPQIATLRNLRKYLIEFRDSSTVERVDLKEFLEGIREKLVSKPVAPVTMKLKQQKPKRPPKKPQIPKEYKKLFGHLTAFQNECGAGCRLKTFWKWLSEKQILLRVNEDFEHWYKVVYRKAKNRYDKALKECSKASS